MSVVLQMQQNNRKDKRKQHRKWLKNYLKLKRFLATPKGRKQALNALERKLKKDVIEPVANQTKDIIEKWTPVYAKIWKAEWRINKEVDHEIFIHLGFVKRPTFLNISDRTLDRNVFRYIEEIEMSKLIQEKNSKCTSLKCDCTDYDCNCKIEQEQDDLAWINDYHEYVAKGGKDPIRLMELIYNLRTYEATEATFQLLSKDKQHKKRIDNKKTIQQQEQLGSKPVSIKRLQYESLGYYTKKCETCDKFITIKKGTPYDYDSNNFHSCFEDGSGKK